MATTCDLPLVGVDNDSCTAIPLGKQPVMLLFQDMRGTAPDLITVGTNDTRLATLQAALTVPANQANAADQLFLINNLAGGTIGAAADETISGNDSPRGVTRLTGRLNTLTARVDYLTPENNQAMNDINARGGDMRLWYVDDLNYVHGPIPHASMIYGNLQLPGIGNATTHRGLTATWRGIAEPAFAKAPLVGLDTQVNG